MKKISLSVAVIVCFMLLVVPAFAVTTTGSSPVNGQSSGVSAAEMNATIAAGNRKITRSILKSRAIEQDHHFILKHENGEIRAGIKSLAEAQQNQFGWLGDQIFSNTVLLAFFGLVATVVLVTMLFTLKSQILAAIRALGNSARPATAAPAAPNATAPVHAPQAPTTPFTANAPAPAGATQAPGAPVPVAPVAPIDFAHLEARADARQAELVELINTIPTATAALVKRLDPMVLNFTDVSGKQVTYTPTIVTEGGSEWYLTPYVPNTVSQLAANASLIPRARVTDKGALRRSARRAIAEYIALTAPAATAPANVREQMIIQLGDYLKATGELVIT